MKGPTAVAASLLLVLTACSASTEVTITPSEPVVLADEAVQLKVSGLKAHQTVTIGTRAVDVKGKEWHAEAQYAANDAGVVALDQAGPSGGSYQGRDGMGLFWSMNPPDGDPEQQSFVPPTKDGRPASDVQVTVRRDGKALASTTVTRQWLTDKVATKTLTVATDKVNGMLFLPTGAAKRPAVLEFGGSEGGLGGLGTASLLASHGYPTLVLAYFNGSGLPGSLRNIPVEYFAAGARLLAKQPGVDPAHVVAMSASYGTEAALLLAQYFPELVHGAVLCSPSATVSESFPSPGAPAWTLGGKPVEPGGLIPVDHVSGPVLALAGTDDQLWQSWTAAPLIDRELTRAHNPYPHQALVFPGAGHAIGGAPYTPHGTSPFHPVIQRPLPMGGTRPVNEAALLEGWTKTLELLQSL